MLTKEEIGQILKGLRVRAGMTQKEVAEAIGRKQQVIGHWETGYSQPDANTLFVLCDMYNADINEAFGFTSKKVNLNKHEQSVIDAYRNNPDMQTAVDRLLKVETPSEARSEYHAKLTDEEIVSLEQQRTVDRKKDLHQSTTSGNTGTA